MDNIVIQKCKNCYFYNPEKGNYGNCSCPVLFPDSTYSRCAGYRRAMKESDGRSCLTFKQEE